MKLSYDQKRVYDILYKDGIIKYSSILEDIDFNILVNLRRSNLIYSFIDLENNLCYKLKKDHPYYIKRKRSENLNKIKDETY